MTRICSWTLFLFWEKSRLSVQRKKTGIAKSNTWIPLTPRPNLYNPFSGIISLIDGHTGLVPPGPISNPEVKRALVVSGTGIFLGAAPTLSVTFYLLFLLGASKKYPFSLWPAETGLSVTLSLFFCFSKLIWQALLCNTWISLQPAETG